MIPLSANGSQERTLQRVIMPVDGDPDVLRLYIDGHVVLKGVPIDPAGPTEEELAEKVRTSRRSGVATLADRPEGAQILGRHSLLVPMGHRLSLCTYFNAFPASYWRRWSAIDQVRLRIRLRGEATVFVYRSSSKLHVKQIASVHIDSDTPQVHEFTLSLEPFVDGGWYWLEVAGGDRNAVLEEAEWCADTVRTTRGRATIGITTYNRPTYCVDQLIALANSPEVLEVIDEILVVDQGAKRVVDDPDYPEAATALAGRLRIIDQGNLGGSGGFARAMEESVQSERSDYVLLLDDDVILEPESILRATTFADLARTPTIVGGHMLSLYDRPVLHAYGEMLERYRWFWFPAPHTFHGHNFAIHPLRHTPWLHRRVDVDYNGWWMCLIPTDVVRKIGLALPLFIKWDDAEYGVRAGGAGFPTVSLPGVAVWHMPWHEKDDTLDWQAYFHERNRVISALLHSPYERGGNLVKESFLVSMKHALAMQYSTVELMLMAVEDVLAGPDHLHSSIITRLPEIRALRAGFPDSQFREDLDQFPRVRPHRPPRRGRGPVPPPHGRRRAMIKYMAKMVLRHLKRVRPHAKRHPETLVPHIDQHWWLLAQFDSALVSSADGSRVAWYQRDRRRFRSLLRHSAVLHARLAARWPQLSERYRAELPTLTSGDTWRRTFAASKGKPSGSEPPYESK